MTDQDQQWLALKRKELSRAKEMFGDAIRMWDTPKFLTILAEKEREIRRLKTMLAAKATA